MPTFLDYQRQARRRSRQFATLYALSLCGVVALLVVLSSVVLRMAEPSEAQRKELDWIPPLVAAVAVLVGGMATLIRMQELRGGGAVIAESLGARRIGPAPTDVLERRFRNVVEEMALASGLPVPEAFVLDGEPGINAFAAGRTPNDAAVAVTSGALRLLTREELQCVVAHEFSHILNGDMRLNVRMLGCLSGLLCIAALGGGLARIAFHMPTGRKSRDSRSDNSGGGALLLVCLGCLVWLVGQVGVLFARLLQATISRQREFLADASAVQFTRNGDGMVSALKVIGATPHRSALARERAGEIAHMLFTAGGEMSLLATHPPLLARILRFEPDFDGNFEPVRQTLELRRKAAREESQAENGDEEDESAVLAAALARRFARQARHSEPGGLPFLKEALTALRNPTAAPGALAGALLADTASRDEQRQALQACPEAEAFPGLWLDATLWAERHRRLRLQERLAACEIAAAALRSEPDERRRALVAILQALAEADGMVSPLEWAVERYVRNRLLPPSEVSERPAASMVAETRALLHALAAYGTSNDASCKDAWAAGLATLPASFAAREPTDESLPDMRTVGMALDTLRALNPTEKEAFLAACRAVVEFDGAITEEEIVALAAIADTLGAPAMSISELPDSPI